ncbi:response regulator [Mucilaginibacter sp. HMF5004]|uniref:hybrid sensor histidine kinase/response regulator transcription factor n=1 Tax=Mucilaginibacter rivuli TaxID=2857527 RepID=UPI001C6036BD|nr:hybrid sensor histidine kinase/response regulator transcription factor [Mucilaginibacter rivuli]MBW4888521.1 response regulator [Mucilaginibacter rivuli]
MVNKVTIRCCLLIVSLCLGLQHVFAQKDFNFTSLTTKNGLSSNTINVILQDHNGLLWFGTSDGLNKFDGTNVTVYTHIERDNNSIPANEVISLLEDHSGRLWVGTSGSGLAYYDGRHNTFITYKANGKRNIWSVRSLCEDHTGKIWAGSYNGFSIIDPVSGKVEFIDITHLLNNSDEVLAALSLFEDNKHRMWMGTSSGVLLFDEKTKKSISFTPKPSDTASIGGNNIKAITQDKQGRLFFGTDKGLSMLLPNEKEFRTFRHSEQQPSSITNDVVYSAIVDAEGKVWIGTEDGISVFDPSNQTSLNARPNRRKSFSLTHKSVRSIYLAQRGIIWFGTYQGGVNKYDPNLALFNLKRSSPFDPQGLASPAVTSFAEYTSDKIFVGTDGGGLHLFDRNTGLFERCTIKSKVTNSDNSLPIQAMDFDLNNKLWIGTFQNGLFVYDPITKQYKQYLAGPTNHDLSQNDIFFIKKDKHGLMWLGTNGRGVDVFDPKTQTFSRYNSKSTVPLPLNGFMRTMAEDDAGDIWLGSVGTGIAVLHPSTQTFKVYNKANSNLSDDGVLCIYHDRADNIWAGTNNGGLNLFDKKSNRFTQFNETNGLSNGIVYKILQDTRGIIWISTDKGISSIDPATKKIKNFSRPNGVQDSPFILGSGIRTSGGELFFGGQDGFNYFAPETLPTSNFMPPILLTELKVSNNTVIPGPNAPIDQQISSATDIHLPYGQNFSINYVALNYTAPQQNHYSYKLKGFDRDWNYVNQEKTAYYTNIDPGDYVFEVRASNNDGVWNNKVTTINVHVAPPLWRTVYAYICYFILAASLLFYVRQRGIQKIKNQLELEQEKINAQQLVKQQRQEAERIHELDLQKIKFLTNLSHEFRTPISLILAPADKLLSLPKDPAIGNQVKMIRRNARRLLNLVNQLLDFRKMEEQELKLNLSQADLVAFIKEAAESFQDLSDRKKISLLVESTIDTLPTSFDPDKMERIVFNLLSNAFKFTEEGGLISVRMSIIDDEIQQMSTFCLTVSDTGIGIPGDIQNRIFDRFFMNSSGSTILNQGSGIGLSIVKEFVLLHGGEITVKSEVTEGTTFYLTLPVVRSDNFTIDQVTDTDESPSIQDELVDNIPTPQDLKVATILLVEDNEEFRFHLKDSLQSFYHIIEASNGKEGWQKALASHPQLIVSDINMPYMGGIELSQKIKNDKRTSQIPVILLTAMNAEEDQIKGLESGANDYLTKPFNFDILNTKIKNLLLYKRSLKDTYSKQIEVVGKEIKIESNDARLLNNVVKYIDEKLNDSELSVEELSRHIGMSRGSLYHKLLELTGLTPIEYIRSIKLDRAATFLEKSDYNVAQIAYMTGFGTPSYFSRLFKAKYGVLPSEYISAKRKDSKSRLGNDMIDGL